MKRRAGLTRTWDAPEPTSLLLKLFGDKPKAKAKPASGGKQKRRAAHKRERQARKADYRRQKGLRS